jgi:hypothetical protein
MDKVRRFGTAGRPQIAVEVGNRNAHASRPAAGVAPAESPMSPPGDATVLNARNAAPALVLLPAVALAALLGGTASFATGLFQTRSERIDIEEQRELESHLDVIKGEVVRRVAIKNALVAELIAGRTTLSEVTGQFLILNQSRPDVMAIIRATYPGSTDQEKSAHNVIAYLRVELNHAPPAEQTEVLTRLKIEFDRAYPANSGWAFPGDLTPAGKEPSGKPAGTPRRSDLAV